MSACLFAPSLLISRKRGDCLPFAEKSNDRRHPRVVEQTKLGLGLISARLFNSLLLEYSLGVSITRVLASNSQSGLEPERIVESTSTFVSVFLECAGDQ